MDVCLNVSLKAKIKQDTSELEHVLMLNMPKLNMSW